VAQDFAHPLVVRTDWRLWRMFFGRSYSLNMGGVNMKKLIFVYSPIKAGCFAFENIFQKIKIHGFIVYILISSIFE
jgi:hypothetical protein